jgi:transcriptional regulator with XRE-family HTH domain
MVVKYSFRMEGEKADNRAFANWVRGQLRRRQWNDAELARRLGVPNGTVSRWMTGERRPNPQSCDRVADLLGADVDMVLTLAGHRPAPAPVDPQDERAGLIAMLNRVDLTPDRLAGLEATLLAWLELDRAARGEATERG